MEQEHARLAACTRWFWTSCFLPRFQLLLPPPCLCRSLLRLLWCSPLVENEGTETQLPKLAINRLNHELHHRYSYRFFLERLIRIR